MASVADWMFDISGGCDGLILDCTCGSRINPKEHSALIPPELQPETRRRLFSLHHGAIRIRAEESLNLVEETRLSGKDKEDILGAAHNPGPWSAWKELGL